MGFGLITLGVKVMMVVGMMKLFFHKKEIQVPAIFYGVTYFIWRLIFLGGSFLETTLMSLLIFAGVFSWLYWLLKMEVGGLFYGVVGIGCLILFFF